MLDPMGRKFSHLTLLLLSEMLSCLSHLLKMNITLHCKFQWQNLLTTANFLQQTIAASLLLMFYFIWTPVVRTTSLQQSVLSFPMRLGGWTFNFFFSQICWFSKKGYVFLFYNFYVKSIEVKTVFLLFPPLSVCLHQWQI